VDWDTEKSRWHSDEVLAPEEETLQGKNGESGEKWLKQEAILRKQGSAPRLMGGLQSLWRERLEKEDRHRTSVKSSNKSNAETIAKTF